MLNVIFWGKPLLGIVTVLSTVPIAGQNICNKNIIHTMTSFLVIFKSYMMFLQSLEYNKTSKLLNFYLPYSVCSWSLRMIQECFLMLLSL